MLHCVAGFTITDQALFLSVLQVLAPPRAHAVPAGILMQDPTITTDVLSSAPAPAVDAAAAAAAAVAPPPPPAPNAALPLVANFTGHDVRAAVLAQQPAWPTIPPMLCCWR
jgi:hypothetical protein